MLPDAIFVRDQWVSGYAQEMHTDSQGRGFVSSRALPRCRMEQREGVVGGRASSAVVDIARDPPLASFRFQSLLLYRFFFSLPEWFDYYSR